MDTKTILLKICNNTVKQKESCKDCKQYDNCNNYCNLYKMSTNGNNYCNIVRPINY